MNLRRRLDALAAARPSSSLATVPPPSFEKSSSGTAEQLSGATRAGELRAHLQAVLGSSGAAQAAQGTRGRRSRETRFETLGFEPMVTAHGRLWARSVALPSAHRVGMATLEPLLTARPEALARVALDPAVAGAEPHTWLFLDLETTGLGGASALPFVVGLAYIDAAGGARVRQLCLAEPDEEAALLAYICEQYAAATLIVTYNGKSFDRPLLESRCVMHRLPALPLRPQLDLLHVGRRLHRRRLGSCTLKRIESDVLGFERQGDIDGSEVAARYGQFLRCGDAAVLRDVIEHNFWDMVSMLALAGLYGQAMPALSPEDLAGFARTLKRAGARAEAELAADHACERGGGIEALRVRASLAKARGDCWAAVRDLEHLCAQVDDPAGHLELAKLYEHAVGRPELALKWVRRGTAENPLDQARRRKRLEQKLQRTRTGPASEHRIRCGNPVV